MVGINFDNGKQKQKGDQIMSEENRTAMDASWDTDFGGSKNNEEKKDGEKKKIKFTKFSKPANYKVRLVGKHVEFLAWWDPFGKQVITHQSYKDNDPAWKSGRYPQKKWAIHILNRTTGEVEVLAKNKKFFEPFALYKAANDINPADLKEAPDFVISVEHPNGDSRQAKYKIMPCQKATPITKEELEQIREHGVKLPEVFKAWTLERIQEAWDALPDDVKVKKDDDKSFGKKKADTRKETSEALEKDSVTTDSEDDLFGSDGDVGEEVSF